MKNLVCTASHTLLQVTQVYLEVLSDWHSPYTTIHGIE